MADSASAFPPEPSRLSRLRGLDPARVLDGALSPELPTESGSGPRQTPSVEDLAALLPEYEILGIMGRGGMGTVYRAVQKKLARPVAIKVLPLDLGDEPGFAERFRHEAMTTAGLPHPDIVAVHDTGETVAGHWYYVMELVEGQDLAQRMAMDRMPLEEIVPLLEVICGALQAAHAKGIVHRDLKPSNILLTPEGRPKLADFGLALLMQKTLEVSRLTLGGTTLGTLEYAAPEQLDGAGATPASDIYSLGVLAYELLTGELPRGVFDPPSVRNPEVDPAFDGVVLRALQSDPDRRFQSAADFCQALRQAADRRWQQQQRERDLRRKLVQRARLAVLLGGLALIAAGSAFYAWRANREANHRRAAAVAAEAKTDGVIQFLLTDLRRRLEATGNLDAMDSVLERAVAHYRGKYALSGEIPEAARQLADVLVIKADVIGVRGLNDEADALYTEAIALTTAALQATPRATASGLRVVEAWQDRSEHRMATGRYPEALADARQLLEEAESLQPLSDSVPVRRSLATAHRAIANALGYTGPFAESRQEYLTAQQLLAALVAAHPDDQALRDALADLDVSLGSLAEAQKDYPAMLQGFTAWHEYVKSRYGPDNLMYSYSSFRMGVALVKIGRPAEAVPYLTDAIRLAEARVAAEPGHHGALNHLSWCLRVMAEAHEAAGDAAQAAAFRRREAEAGALANQPTGEGSDKEQLFANLLAKAGAAPHEAWWSFCQRLQGEAESEADPKLRRAFYEMWIARAAREAATRPAGDFVNTVEAFCHNRLSVQLLETDGTAAAAHASRALDLRRAIAQTHPGDTALERNVLSSAGHLVRASLKAEQPSPALTAFARYAEAAGELSPAMLVERDQGLAFATDAAGLLEFANTRWPESAPAFAQTGSALATALLDRLPEDRKTPDTAALRTRLTALEKPAR